MKKAPASLEDLKFNAVLFLLCAVVGWLLAKLS